MRRLRGILGAAIIWAVAWIPLGIAFGIRRWLLTPWGDLGPVPQRPAALPIIANTIGSFMIWGALVGCVFAVALLSAERRRTLLELSGLRLALWGGLSAVMPLVAIMVGELVLDWSLVVILLIAAGWGALCAAAFLRVAQGQYRDVAA